MEDFRGTAQRLQVIGTRQELEPVFQSLDKTRTGKLDLGDNALSGTLPSAVGDLGRAASSHLSFLSVASNRLSGALPSQLGRLTALTNLQLSYNSLSGPLPSFCSNGVSSIMYCSI